MDVHVLTLFPGLFEGWLAETIIGKAVERGLVRITIHNLRDWTTDRHGTVDDRPFGGGPGMVIKPEPVFDAVEAICGDRSFRTILLSPRGRRFEQKTAKTLATDARPLLLICGRYEGFDERIRIGLEPEEISIGDYILNGGEVAAMAILEAATRLVPEVLGHEESAVSESFENDRLDFPQYTRPVEYRGMAVPDVLRSGDHAKIEAWRKQEAERLTRERRPDLLDERAESEE